LAYRAVDAVLRMLLPKAPQELAERVALQWGYRFRPRPRIVRLRSGMRFNFERVDHIPLLLHYAGTFEPQVIALLGKLVKPGDIVLDVGANIGFHTLEAWRAVGSQGRVISIEASSDHADAVKRNLELNRLPTRDVHNIAVGDYEGEVKLGLPAGGNQGMFGINAGDGEAFSVPMKRIDDVIDVPRLALIKMDIEGSELGALRGAEQTIRKYKPAILMELNDEALKRCGASSYDVVSFLRMLGYGGSVIGRKGLRPIQATDVHECDECLFTP
jgi:FkbM family methyltransferase